MHTEPNSEESSADTLGPKKASLLPAIHNARTRDYTSPTACSACKQLSAASVFDRLSRDHNSTGCNCRYHVGSAKFKGSKKQMMRYVYEPRDADPDVFGPKAPSWLIKKVPLKASLRPAN